MMWRVFLVWLLCAMPASAQEFSALARVDAANSELRDAGDGLSLDLRLSIPVPYRVFTVDAPRRAVVDFREADWREVDRTALLNADNATDLRFGPLRPGWSRLVIDLAAPMIVQEAGMMVDQTTGEAQLTVVLAATDQARFAAKSGAPDDPQWGALIAASPLEGAASPDDGPMIVAIDAGHGGIDPGALHGGLKEADLMLRLAFAVVDAINRSGEIQAFLVRDTDHFIPLEERMTRARAEGASAFISLHADALEAGGARGASVYTLSADAQDDASLRMAERHEQGDLLAGLDLSGQDDRIATVLMDLARLETGPAGDRLADALIDGMSGAGVILNSRPRRSGKLAVLNAADFASVLIEVGFLSSDADRAVLSSADGRQRLAIGITNGVLVWANEQAARAPLIRQ